MITKPFKISAFVKHFLALAVREKFPALPVRNLRRFSYLCRPLKTYQGGIYYANY
jgi:hypothetical protein